MYTFDSVINLIHCRHGNDVTIESTYLPSLAEPKTIPTSTYDNTMKVMFNYVQDYLYITLLPGSRPIKDVKKVTGLLTTVKRIVLINNSILKEKPFMSFLKKIYGVVDVVNIDCTIECIHIDNVVLRINNHISFPESRLVIVENEKDISGNMSIEDPICIYNNYNVDDCILMSVMDPLGVCISQEIRKVKYHSVYDASSTRFVSRFIMYAIDKNVDEDDEMEADIEPELPDNSEDDYDETDIMSEDENNPDEELEEEEEEEVDIL